MARYYFDMREGDEIAPDEEGMELSSHFDSSPKTLGL